MTIKNSFRVAVLMGGDSPEREISLKSGRAVAEALVRRSHDVLMADVSHRFCEPMSLSENDNPSEVTCQPHELAAVFSLFKPHVVLPELHGGYGEDGTIQSFLELLRVPYACSPPSACAMAMDKTVTKRLCLAVGIPTPEFVIVARGETVENTAQLVRESVGFPCVVKPACLGSTVGLGMVNGEHELEDAVRSAFEFDTVVIIERRITGVEITCAVFEEIDGARALPLIEIVPQKADYYDWVSKYEPGGSEHLIPPRLDPRTVGVAQNLAVKVHKLLGCCSITRTDMLVEADGSVVVLELNAIPGMTPTSLVPDAARAAGISFDELVERIAVTAVDQTEGIFITQSSETLCS